MSITILWILINVVIIVLLFIVIKNTAKAYGKIKELREKINEHDFIISALRAKAGKLEKRFEKAEERLKLHAEFIDKLDKELQGFRGKKFLYMPSKSARAEFIEATPAPLKVKTAETFSIGDTTKK